MSVTSEKIWFADRYNLNGTIGFVEHQLLYSYVYQWDQQQTSHSPVTTFIGIFECRKEKKIDQYTSKR